MARKSLDTISQVIPKPGQIVFPKETDLKLVDKKLIPQKRTFIKDRLKRKYKKVLFRLVIAALILIVLGGIFYLPFKTLYSFSKLIKTGTYLVLFQNNAELRGGGGFLGSFAVVNLQGQHLKSYYFEANIYKKDNVFTNQNKVPLPDYFYKVFDPKASLALRDANYPADFAKAAENVSHFYQLEYGQPVNGVIAIDASLLKNLLVLTGPVKIENQNTTVDSNNFFNLVQEQVDKNYFLSETNLDVNEPKNILKEMVDPLLKKVQTVSPIRLYNFATRQIATKHLLFWFPDTSRQQLVENNRWAGRIEPSNKESIFVSNNNIGGEKSSLSVSQSLLLEGPSQKSSNRTLTITRHHNGGTDYAANKENKNYLKAFLPLGSSVNDVSLNNSLVKTNDLTISEESSRLVVGLWANTPLNQTTTVKINYSLPKSLDTNHILYQKQPGVIKEDVEIIFDDRIYFKGSLDRDRLI